MGLNEEGLPTFQDQNGNISISDIYFQDREHTDFLQYSGSADPTDIGSLGNTFTYKNFRLNLFITYSFGNVIRLDPVFKKNILTLPPCQKNFVTAG